MRGGIEARILSVLLHLPGLHLHAPNEKFLQIHEAPAHCNCIPLTYPDGNQKKSIALIIRLLANLTASS